MTSPCYELTIFLNVEKGIKDIEKALYLLHVFSLSRLKYFVNVPFLCSNKTASLAYSLFVLQLIHLDRPFPHYVDPGIMQAQA